MAGLKPLPQGVEAHWAVGSPEGLIWTEGGIYPERMLAGWTTTQIDELTTAQDDTKSPHLIWEDYFRSPAP
jgi:hypothetical protein